MSDAEMKPTMVADFPPKNDGEAKFVQDPPANDKLLSETKEALKSPKTTKPKIPLDKVHRRYPAFPKMADDSADDNHSVVSDATPNSNTSDDSTPSSSSTASPKSPRASNRYLSRPYARSRNRWVAQQQQFSDKASGHVILAEPHSFRPSPKAAQQSPHETRNYNQSTVAPDLLTTSKNERHENKNQVIHELQMIIDDEKDAKQSASPPRELRKGDKIQDDESTLSCSDNEVDQEHSSSAAQTMDMHYTDVYFSILSQPLHVPSANWCGQYIGDMCNSAMDTMIRWEHDILNPKERQRGVAIQASE